MYYTPKEPTKVEKIENIEENLKYLHKELRNAKSYWKKLTIKQDIAVLVRELKDLIKEL